MSWEVEKKVCLHAVFNVMTFIAYDVFEILSVHVTRLMERQVTFNYICKDSNTDFHTWIELLGNNLMYKYKCKVTVKLIDVDLGLLMKDRFLLQLLLSKNVGLLAVCVRFSSSKVFHAIDIIQCYWDYLSAQQNIIFINHKLFNLAMKVTEILKFY